MRFVLILDGLRGEKEKEPLSSHACIALVVPPTQHARFSETNTPAYAQQSQLRQDHHKHDLGLQTLGTAPSQDSGFASTTAWSLEHA